MQRRAVFLLQPARLDDAAAARVEAGERLLQAGGLHARRLFGLQHAVRLAFVVGEVLRRGVAVLVVVVGLERDLLPGEPLLHLDHFLGLDAQLGGHALDVGAGQRGEAALHRAQVEEQLPLRLGRGELDHAPVAQDVLVDLGLDPVDRERHEAHAALRVEALHGLHQADVAFLDQVRVRQPIAEVAAGDRHHQPQVRQHQRAGGFQVAFRAEALRKGALFFRGENRKPVDRVDVGLEAARGHRYGHRTEGHRRRLRLHSSNLLGGLS